MTHKYWRLVDRVMRDADILLLVLDARLIEETRNKEVERRVARLGKPLIYVVNKSDLVSGEKLDAIEVEPRIIVSVKEHKGTMRLRQKIVVEGKRAYPGQKEYVVGVLGYPNVGKSSIINALKGKKSAPTSPVSGYTKSLQKIRAGSRIMLLDTPGVVPEKEKDFGKHVLIGTIDSHKIKNPDLAVMKLMEKLPGRIEKHYGVEVSEDFEEVIEKIAVKMKLLKKGGVSDIERCARRILKDWQTGKIK